MLHKDNEQIQIESYQFTFPIEVWFVILNELPPGLFVAMIRLLSKELSIFLTQSEYAKQQENRYWLKFWENTDVRVNNQLIHIDSKTPNEILKAFNMSADNFELHMGAMAATVENGELIWSPGGKKIKDKIMWNKAQFSSLYNLYVAWKSIEDFFTSGNRYNGYKSLGWKQANIDNIQNALVDLNFLAFRQYQFKFVEPHKEIARVKANILYIKNLENLLQYTVLNAQGEVVTGKIKFSELDEKLASFLSLKDIEPFFPVILKIAIKNGHAPTHENFGLVLKDTHGNHYSYEKCMRLRTLLDALLHQNILRLIEEKLVSSFNDLFVMDEYILKAVLKLANHAWVLSDDIKILLEEKQRVDLLSSARRCEPKINYIADILVEYPQYKLSTLLKVKALVLKEVYRSLKKGKMPARYLTPDYLEKYGQCMKGDNMVAFRKNSNCDRYLEWVPIDLLFTANNFIIKRLLNDDFGLQALQKGILVVDKEARDIYFASDEVSIFKLPGFDFSQRLEKECNDFQNPHKRKAEYILPKDVKKIKIETNVEMHQMKLSQMQHVPVSAWPQPISEYNRFAYMNNSNMVMNQQPMQMPNANFNAYPQFMPYSNTMPPIHISQNNFMPNQYVHVGMQQTYQPYQRLINSQGMTNLGRGSVMVRNNNQQRPGTHSTTVTMFRAPQGVNQQGVMNGNGVAQGLGRGSNSQAVNTNRNFDYTGQTNTNVMPDRSQFFRK